MRVLTIDTATSTAAVGLVIDGVAHDAPAIRSPAAAQHVLPAVDRLLAEFGLAIGDVDAIAVGRGPGSFTGLRIGLATAIGLAAPRGIRLAGVSTAAALRHAAGANAVAVIDARRGEVFAEGNALELGACTAEELARRLPPECVLVGDGAVRYRDAFPAATIPPGDSLLHVPGAAALAELSSAAQPAVPLYVRAPDAVPTELRA